MGEFSAIDPAAMQSMITSYSKDKGDLRNSVTNLKSRFDRFGVDSGDLTEILGICNWLDDQLASLTRHQALGAALEREHPGLAMVQVPEPVVSAAQARKDGKDLADRMNKVTELDGEGGKQYHEIAQQLAAHRDDPDYCSAFYAALSPNLTQNLPNFLASTGSSTAGQDLKAFSQALGVAVSDAYPPPGFDKVRNLFTTPPPKGGRALAWDRGAMLAYGQFPADFLAKAARANVLDDFAHDKDQDFRGASPFEVQALGLPDDTVALYLNDLGDNGGAARLALTQMGQPASKSDLQENIKSLMEYGRTNSDVQTALGKTIDAGAGVQGTTDKDGLWHVTPGAHTADESKFAFASILAAGHDEDVHKFDGLFKQDMGRLAASYAPEMLIGGHNVDENIGESSFDSPTQYDKIPGIDPAFYLSPQDTYRFMKTFADDDGMSAPFDEAMGRLQHDVLVKAAKFDHDANTAGKDARSYDLAAKAFGNTQRLEYDAEMKIRGEMDESEKAFKEHLKQAAILGSEIAGEPELPAAWKMAWRGGMFALKEYGGGAYVESGPERTEVVKEKNFEMVSQARYTMATTLMDGGWKTTPLPDDLKGQDGKIKSFEDLSKDHQLEAFNDWANEQREGEVSFHTKQVLAAGELSNQDADVYVKEVDGE
ncbi:hypothetical protein [Streptomyces sp. NPDC006739]|uniref:hypothetical protein n=1 Tax=Streptomyces sp. NPDC006739 TaxID=3364763 RepID=UPI0036834A27